GVVERLKRAPGPVHEIQAPGVHVAPRRDARHRTDIVAIENHGLPGKTVEIGRKRRLAAIRPKRRAVERVEKNENGSHLNLPFYSFWPIPMYWEIEIISQYP